MSALPQRRPERSQAEREALRRHYPLGGAEGCAPHLPGRTIVAIRDQASYLGVTEVGANKVRAKQIAEAEREMHLAALRLCRLVDVNYAWRACYRLADTLVRQAARALDAERV